MSKRNKPVKEPKPITLDDLIQAHGAALGCVEQSIPENAFTLQDFMEKTGLSATAATHRLKRMEANKIVEIKKFIHNKVRKNFYIPL